MKNKKLLILTIVVSLLLVGSIAFAGYNEDITCDEDGQALQRGGSMVERGYKAFNQDSEVMLEYVAKIQVKLSEMFDKLVTDKTLTQEQVNQIGAFELGKGMRIESTLEDLDDEQCEAIEAAMDEVHIYKNELRTELAEQGLVGRNFRTSSEDAPKGRRGRSLNTTNND